MIIFATEMYSRCWVSLSGQLDARSFSRWEEKEANFLFELPTRNLSGLMDLFLFLFFL